MAEEEAPKIEPTDVKPDVKPDAEPSDDKAVAVEETSAVKWLRTLSEEDQEHVLALAGDQYRQLAADAKKPKEEVKPEPEPTDPLDRVLKELNEIKGKVAARDEKDKKDEETKKKAQEWAGFFASLDSVLDKDETFGEDTDARKELKEGYTGHFFALTRKPSDIGQSFKGFLDREKARIAKYAGKKKEDYVRGKISDARNTRGESSAGSVPPKSEYKPTGADLDSGELAERIKQELGVS